jgi:hypothetical protein
LSAAQRLAHQLPPAVKRPYTARRPDAKPVLRTGLEWPPAALFVNHNLRADSCMRLLGVGLRQVRADPKPERTCRVAL